MSSVSRWFDLSRYPSLGACLEEACQRSRSNVCLTETDRGRVVSELTYRQFRERAGRLAAALAERGVSDGTRVAILMANGPRWLQSAWAILRLGGVVVPLDARLDPDGQTRLLEHCGAQALIADGPAWRRLRDRSLPEGLHTIIISRPLGEPGPRAVDWETAVTHAGLPPVSQARGRNEPAAIVYSSGTSGRPKGCVLTHANYLAQMEALANLFPLEEDDVYLSILPTNHALDFMCGFLIPMLCGARVLHLRTLRPEWILGACRDQGVTHMGAVPALLEALARSLRERTSGLDRLPAAGLEGLRRLNAWLTERRPNHRVSRTLLAPVHNALGGRLRRIFAGGAFVQPETARYLYELGFPVAIGYGLTEACAVVSVNDLQPFRDDTVGRPVAGTEVKLADRDEEGRGEVFVRGPGVFQGYLDDPELTNEVFEDGWLRTGDLGVVDAVGHLRLVGRIKDMIVTSGGKNVYPEEVEGTFASVSCEELAVLSAHRIWPSKPGEDESLVLALRNGSQDGVLAEVASRNRRLPSHQRLAGVLLVDEPFPRTTSLKLKRRELAVALARRPRTELRPL